MPRVWCGGKWLGVEWGSVKAPRRGYVVYGGVKVEMSDSGDGRILNAI